MRRVRVTTSFEFDSPIPGELTIELACPFCDHTFKARQPWMYETVSYAVLQLGQHMNSAHKINFPK